MSRLSTKQRRARRRRREWVRHGLAVRDFAVRFGDEDVISGLTICALKLDVRYLCRCHGFSPTFNMDALVRRAPRPRTVPLKTSFIGVVLTERVLREAQERLLGA